MLHHNTLGHARRTGGIDDIGEMIGSEPNLRRIGVGFRPVAPRQDCGVKAENGQRRVEFEKQIAKRILRQQRHRP